MFYAEGIRQMNDKNNDWFLNTRSLLRHFFSYIWVLNIITAIVFISGFAFASDLYSIHIGSYKSRDNALKSVSHTKSMNYNSFIMEKDDPNGGVWYRVFIGHYNTKKEALVGVSLLKEKKFSGYYAVMRILDKGFSCRKSH